MADFGKNSQTLRKSQEELTDFIEAATLGVHRVGPDGIIQWANRAELQMLGYEADEYFGRHISDFHADQTVIQDIIQRLAHGETIHDHEAVLRAKDGSLRYVRIDSTGFWENGQFKYTRCFTRDETERKRAEEDIRRLNQDLQKLVNELQTVFDVSPMGIGVAEDPECRVIRVNPTFAEMLGISPEVNASKTAESEQLVPFKVFRNGRELQGEELPMQVAAARGITVAGEELELQREDGRMVNVLMHAAPLLDEEGRPRGSVGAMVDITERKEDEHALLEADRRKDQFLAMLAHELRNPLAPITNALQLLRLEQGDASLQQEVIALLERQVGTLTRLVDDLLDVSRVTTGRIHLHKTDIDLNALVQSTADSFRPQMEARQHQFSVTLPQRSLWVKGDPTRLEQVVVNLLSNAAKFSPNGSQIWLSTEEVNGDAIIRVRDSGMGIEADMFPHIFGLFSQGEAGLDRSQGGLGIGLSLVKSLVEMHGGTVTAASEGLGRGSEFVVRLPVVPPPLPEQPQPGEDRHSSAVRLRVLLVEDLEDARRILGRVLSRLGHQVRTAHDGSSALAAALEFRPSVVLLDIGLPGMDGYEVARQMRWEPSLQDAVLVAVTGYGQQLDRQRTHEAGFAHHVVKPVDISELEKLFAAIGSRPA